MQHAQVVGSSICDLDDSRPVTAHGAAGRVLRCRLDGLPERAERTGVHLAQERARRQPAAAADDAGPEQHRQGH
jgi:hypothetical protein